MGRTINPYSIQIEHTLERLKDFRRGLRREDQDAYDSIMRTAKVQVQAGVMASNPNPFDSMVLSILIHLKRENWELQKKLTLLQEKIEEMENARTSL